MQRSMTRCLTILTLLIVITPWSFGSPVAAEKQSQINEPPDVILKAVKESFAQVVGYCDGDPSNGPSCIYEYDKACDHDTENRQSRPHEV